MLPPDSLTVDEAFVPLGAQRGGRSGETPILTSYERAGVDRDGPRELTALTRGQDFGGRTLAVGFTYNANEGSEEYEYYLDGELDEGDTNTSFLRKGGIVVTAVTSPYDEGFAAALLEGSEHPAAAPVNPNSSTVRIGDHLGVLNLADPSDPQGTRPYLLSWHVDGIDFDIRGVVADASELVNWGRALQCRS